MNSMKLLATSVILILVMAVSGCASMGDKDIESSEIGEDLFVSRVPIQLEPIEPLEWRDFEWRILNRERMQDMIDSGQPIRYYALSPQDFENLSLTTQDMLRYINSQRTQLDRVLEYYSLDVDDEDDDSTDE